MLKAAVDHFGACVHTKDFVVFGRLPLPPSLDTAKMLNRTDRTYLTLVDTSMMQHRHYRANIARYLDLEQLPNQDIANPIYTGSAHTGSSRTASSSGESALEPANEQTPTGQLTPSAVPDINPKPPTPPDAATAAGIPVGRSGRTGAYMVEDLLKNATDQSEPPNTPTAATENTDSPNSTDNANHANNANHADNVDNGFEAAKETVEEDVVNQRAPLNMTSLPKERILWVQGGRVDALSSGVALRTVYLLYTDYVIYGDMQLAPQMRFSDHLTNTIKTHPFQVLRNVHLAETSSSSYFSNAPVLAKLDFLTVNLHSIGGAFELSSVS